MFQFGRWDGFALKRKRRKRWVEDKGDVGCLPPNFRGPLRGGERRGVSGSGGGRGGWWCLAELKIGPTGKEPNHQRLACRREAQSECVRIACTFFLHVSHRLACSVGDY